ncbi:hypothetical protein LshimejAT787_2100580 [Lyophyllum shimeji]|uniref:Uncharacterized protein n=1 Tax=Lyophyllum shimeji TaxID=47721 RepID=A0A9P3Q0C3_LYOSH|nr:hypothetical protein LshimejAT787_2100580 [Lyophyllum shimeji]
MVVCTVERERSQPEDDPDSIFTESDTSRLYLSATILGNLSVDTPFQTSPRAILDLFVGSPDEPSAPDWVRSERDVFEFRQPRDTLIALFSRMALWQDNLNEAGLSSAVFDWASAISVGIWAENKILKRRMPHKPIKKWNTKSHSRHLGLGYATVIQMLSRAIRSYHQSLVMWLDTHRSE